MDWIASAYWICLAVGVGYTIVAFIMGGAGHGAVGHDGLGNFGNAGHHGDGSGGEVVFGPFSPLVIAFFLTCLGATGIVSTRVFEHPIFTSLVIASVSGFLLAWGLIALFNRVLGGMQSSSEVTLYSLIGNEGEVTVDIPANSVGEIAYVAMGSRHVAPARSDENTTLARFSPICITRIVGNMFYVAPLTNDATRVSASREESA